MKRPVSITVIAVLLLAGVVLDLLLVPDIRYQFDSIFGIYVFAWWAFSVFLIFVFLDVIVGVGLLKCKPWARVVAILLYAYFVLDTFLTRALPGSFARYTQALSRSHHAVSISTALVSDSTLHVYLRFALPVLVGIPVWCLFIYFLWSRRSAF